jgi:hypothetical protein
MKGDGNDGAPEYGLDKGEDDPDAPGDEQEKDNDPEDGVDQGRFNYLVHARTSNSLECKTPGQASSVNRSCFPRHDLL